MILAKGDYLFIRYLMTLCSVSHLTIVITMFITIYNSILMLSTFFIPIRIISYIFFRLCSVKLFFIFTL